MLKKRFLLSLFAVCMALCCMTVVVSAEEQVITGAWNDTITWSFDVATGTMTITGTGVMNSSSDGSYVPYIKDVKTAVVGANIENFQVLFNHYTYENLERILIDDAHPTYADLNGVVYNKEMTCLEYIPVAFPGDCVISEGVVNIADRNTQKCRNVTSLTIPSTMVELELIPMPNLEKFIVAEGNASYCTDDRGILYNKEMTKLIRMPAQYEGEYTIPESVVSISAWSSFWECHKLTSLHIHARVQGLDSASDFWDLYTCDSLESIWVDPEHPDFCSDYYGVLYSRDMTTLVRIPSGIKQNVFVVPEGVTKIGDGAVDGCVNLKYIDLPQSLVDIGQYAFFNCTGLIEITIPINVDGFGEWAFSGCVNLKDVYFLCNPPWEESIYNGRGMFSNLTLNCYYPANSEAWADGPTMGMHYAQKITWVADPELHDHSYARGVIPPTCTQEGYTLRVCTICGKRIVFDETAPAGHTWQAATCTAPKTCSVCGTTEGDALGHASYTYSYASGVHSFTCTLCGETVTMTDSDSKKFAINSAAPVLSDDIVMKYSTTVPAGFENAYMVFDFNGESFTISDYEVNATSGRYEFKFPGINPQKMSDNICATLYAEVDGVSVSVQIASYSMVKNCDNQLKKSTTDAKTRTMLSDVLMYGEKAQIVTNYKTDVLVTSLLSAASTLTPSTYPESLDASVDMQKRTGTKDDRVQFTAVTLSLGSKMAVRVAVTCTDTSLFTYKVTISGREYTYTGADLVPVNDGSDGKYYLFFNQMKATEFGEKITFTCWEGDTQISYTIEYSVYTFIYRNMSKVDTNTQELLKAIYNYGFTVQ